MRTLILLFVLCGLCATAAAGPKATFDVMTYEAPAGWTAQTKSGALTLTQTNAGKGTFVMVLVSPSTSSRGSLAQDFQASWKTAIAATFNVTAAPAISPGTPSNGWEATAGAAQANVDGVPALVMLVTMTGHGKTMNIVISTNDADAYGGALEQLLGSVVMAAPAKAPAPAPSGSGPTTKFDDGWTATGETDWVRVTRDDATVYLHHPLQHDDASRRDSAVYFWNKLVAPRYTVTRLIKHERSELNFPFDFIQGEATDRDGRKVFVSLRILSQSGLARPIEVVTASAAAMTKLFPDQDKLASIANANRFAVGADVAGNWSGSTGASVDVYNVNTGNYAGMNAAALSDKFTFAAGGAYASVHQGAVGRVGQMATFKTTKKGTYTVAPWEITVKLSDGTTVTYAAHYELARGGRILHLRDKAHTGMGYALARDK